MIKAYLDKKRHKTVFGCQLEEIENYDEAIKAKELYVCHHVLEWKYTSDELKAMNRYWIVKPEKLIFMPVSLHNSAKSIHKSKDKSLQNLRYDRKGKKQKCISMFGKKFEEHYNMHRIDNVKLYSKEYCYYRKHSMCSWEV